MAFFISRRLSNVLLASSRSSSLCFLPLPSTTISKPSSQFCLLHASSSSYPTQKPQLLEPCFIRSAPFATFRPSKPTFSPPNDNSETRYSGQIPSSIHASLLKNELRDSLRKSMDNIKGLKNALTVLGFVHVGIGAWIAGSLQFELSIITQGFLASAVPHFLASNMKQCLQGMSYLNMKTEEGLSLISKLAWLAAWRLFVVAWSWLVVQTVVLCWLPVVDFVEMIPRLMIPMFIMMLLSTLYGIQMNLMPSSVVRKLLRWQLKGKVDDMIRSSNWMERLEVLKVANIVILRFKNASYLAAGLSSSCLLCVHLHSYGILAFDVFE